MTKKESLQTESQSISENNKPWYKKKNTITTSTSVLGAGLFATIIVVPITLSSCSLIPTTTSIQEAINLLNVAKNKDTRISIWNEYMTSLTSVAKASSFDTIIRTSEYIEEFFRFLTDNLYVTAAGTETGAITQTNLDGIKRGILDRKSAFADPALSTYNNLFNFTTSNSTAMFTFKDNATSTIEFTLTMPLAGLDLIYNNDQTISLKTLDHNTTTVANNVMLTVTKFPAAPTITTATNYYFKANSIIKMPTRITSTFPTFFDTKIKELDKSKADITTSLQAIQKSIVDDTTNTIGLSYWNSFALNYATSNNTFLKTEFAKDITTSGVATFLRNAKLENDQSVGLTDTELNEIKTLSSSATSGDFILSATPFATSPSYSNLFFRTNKTGTPASANYSLELTISKFSYEFVMGNLFEGPKAISITPKLELSGKLTKTTTTSKTVTSTNYLIPSALYDVSGLVNMSHDSPTTNGGLIGYFSDLAKTPQSELTKLTNGLVALNNKPIVDQIAFWNSYTTNTTNKPLILAGLKTTDVLFDFIDKNVEWTNPIASTGGTFPTITDSNAVLKTSIKTAMSSYADANATFDINGTAKITLSNIAYGSDATNDKFSSVKIYFGNEPTSMSNFNVTSTESNSNISFKQTLGETTFADKSAAHVAAAKRFSIVFEKDTHAFVFYFGQGKVTQGNTNTQVVKPVIIPQTILTPTTNFITAIKAVIKV